MSEQNKSNNLPPAGRILRSAALSSIVASAAILLCALWYGGHGFEFTDDGYYLAWVTHRSRYLWSASQFAFIYGPAFDLLGRNVVLYRILNLLLVVGLASILVALWIRAHRPDLPNFTRMTAAIGLSTSAFGILGPQISSPNYNTLAFTAMLVVSIGLVLALRRRAAFATIGGLLTGAGGWLCFMAKPSSAAALAGCVFIIAILPPFRTFRFWAAAASNTLGLLLLSAWLIDGSVTGFVERLRLGYEMQVLSGAGYSGASLLRWDSLQLTQQDAVAWLIAFFGTIAAIGLGSLSLPKLASAILFISALLVFWIIFGALGWIALPPSMTAQTGVPLLSIGLASGLSGLSARFGLLRAAQRPIWSIAIAFLLFPYVFAFGTNTNYWNAASSVAFFWVLAGLAPLMTYIRTPNTIVIVTAATQIISAIILYGGIEQPYRQPAALWMNETLSQIGGEYPELRIDSEYAAYILEVQNKATGAGLLENEPVIDLTGQSPGLLYALRAVPLGYPWLAGGFSGSAEVLARSLELENCKTLSAAWLLVEPNGPRAINTDGLTEFALQFPNTYRLAASWYTRRSMGRLQTQELWMPINKAQIATNCGKLRSELLRHP